MKQPKEKSKIRQNHAIHQKRFANPRSEVNLKKEINKNVLLNIIMWTNDFYSEINEFCFVLNIIIWQNIFKKIL